MRLALSCLVLAFAILLVPAHSEPGRPRAAEGYARRLVSAGLLELPTDEEGVRTVVHEGRPRADVTPLDVAVALPGALVARAAHDDSRARQLGAMLLPFVLLASIGGIFFSRLRRTSGLGLPLGHALAATLALLFSTSLLLALRRADATLVAVLALLMLVDRLSSSPLLRDRLHFLELGLLSLTLILAQPAYELVALALVLLDVARRRGTMGLAVPLLLSLLPLLLAAVGWRVWSLRVGLPPETSDAHALALYGLLLSPGRSLFVYSPIALVGVLGLPKLWARDRVRTEAICIALLAGLWGVAARADWHGDPAFGPPLVLPLLPLLVEPAALMLVSLTGRALFTTAAMAGVVVQLLGVSVNVEAWPRVMSDVRVATGAPGWFLAPASDIQFVPQLSPLVGHALLLPISLGMAPPKKPPFALVVGSDQADAGKPDRGWQEVAARLDRRKLRPDLLIAAGSSTFAVRQLVLWMLVSVLSFFLLARARRRS